MILVLRNRAPFKVAIWSALAGLHRLAEDFASPFVITRQHLPKQGVATLEFPPLRVDG